MFQALGYQEQTVSWLTVWLWELMCKQYAARSVLYRLTRRVLGEEGSVVSAWNIWEGFPEEAVPTWMTDCTPGVTRVLLPIMQFQ